MVGVLAVLIAGEVPLEDVALDRADLGVNPESAAFLTVDLAVAAVAVGPLRGGSGDLEVEVPASVGVSRRLRVDGAALGEGDFYQGQPFGVEGVVPNIEDESVGGI